MKPIPHDDVTPSLFAVESSSSFLAQNVSDDHEAPKKSMKMEEMHPIYPTQSITVPLVNIDETMKQPIPHDYVTFSVPIRGELGLFPKIYTQQKHYDDSVKEKRKLNLREMFAIRGFNDIMSSTYDIGSLWRVQEKHVGTSCSLLRVIELIHITFKRLLSINFSFLTILTSILIICTPITFARYYEISPLKYTYSSAQSYCEHRGMNLASFNNLESAEWAAIVCSTKPADWCWMGFDDIDGDGEYEFVDGTSFNDRGLWASGSPDIGECGLINIDSNALSIKDVSCTSSYYAICCDLGRTDNVMTVEFTPSTTAYSDDAILFSSSDGAGRDVIFFLAFNIVGNACVNPTFNLRFYDNDYDGYNKFLHLYSYYNGYYEYFLCDCGRNGNVCDDLTDCIDDFVSPKLIGTLGVGTQVRARIVRGPNTDNSCSWGWTCMGSLYLQCQPDKEVRISTVTPQVSNTIEDSINHYDMYTISSETEYWAVFHIADVDCDNPMISIRFEDSDYNGANKYLKYTILYYYLGNNPISKSGTCAASGSSCGVYKWCLQNYDIPDLDTIHQDSQIQVRLKRGSGVNAGSGCTYTFWANAYLQCGPPTVSPTAAPTPSPSPAPTAIPTLSPTPAPTVIPTDPSYSPTNAPTSAPSTSPSSSPTMPTVHPTFDPTIEPTFDPTAAPSSAPSFAPSFPSFAPSSAPSFAPTAEPTLEPTVEPTMEPTLEPTTDPTYDPTTDPTADPTMDPTKDPTIDPTFDPTKDPTHDPTVDPTIGPTFDPTIDPTADPSQDPTSDPTVEPTAPSTSPTYDPTIDPTADPTAEPTTDPTNDPTKDPTYNPTIDPTIDPSIDPTNDPSFDPTFDPTIDPTVDPTCDPTTDPTIDPTSDPTSDPTNDPTMDPTMDPTSDPTSDPTVDPTSDPTTDPTNEPTLEPTASPTFSPSVPPSIAPSYSPSAAPTVSPSYSPTTCVLYDKYGDSDSVEIDDKLYDYNYNMTQTIIDEQNRISTATKDVMEYGAVNMAGETVECDSSITASICYMRCEGEIYCRGSVVIPIPKMDHDNIDELIIICSGRAACESMKIDIRNTNIGAFTMICSSGLSCELVEIVVEAQNEMDIAVYCHDSGGLSCEGMRITLYANDNVLNTTIGCYSASSCDNLYFAAIDGSNIDLTIEMYEYSENVQIVYEYYEEIRFICAAPHAQQSHFIRFDVDRSGTNLKSDSEIEQLAKDEYKSGKFPCEGIVIDCSGRFVNEYECFINYELIHSVNQHDIRNSDEYINCFWIDIYKLYDAQISCLTVNACGDESTATASNGILSDGYTALILCSVLIGVCGIILILYFKLQKAKKKIAKESKEAILVKNPMVIIIGIGEYEEKPSEPHDEIAGAQIADLKVDIDVRNLINLFGRFNYDIFPSYKDIENPEIKWTKTELIKELKNRAFDLNKSVNRNDDPVDGLIFIISSHGLNNNIITADYKFIDKDVIHRIFSLEHPNSRKIPRIFIYDCCDGTADKQQSITKGNNESKKHKEMRIQDNDSIAFKYRDLSKSWLHGELNPDYRLAKLNATNKGFQSKMNNTTGSNMIYKFVHKMGKHLDENPDKIPFLGDIVAEIQDELSGDQQTTHTWSNHTQNIQLQVKEPNVIRKAIHIDDDAKCIEMIHHECEEQIYETKTKGDNSKAFLNVNSNAEIVHSDSDHSPDELTDIVDD